MGHLRHSFHQLAGLRLRLDSRARLEVLLGLCAMGYGLSVAPAGAAPWALAIPVVLGLVHGFGAAALGAFALLLLGPFGLAERLGLAPRDISLVWPLLALAAGELRDSLDARRARAERASADATEKLERMFREYETLRSSHLALETTLGAEGWSLDAACRELERVAQGGLAPRAQSEALLGVLGAHASVSRGAVYLLDASGALPQRASACLGQAVRGAPGALVEKACAESRAVLLNEGDPRQEAGLAALPLLTASGKLLGALVIDAVPFTRLNRQQIGLMRAICGRFADGFATPVQGALPPLPIALRDRLQAPERSAGSAVRRIPHAESGIHTVESGIHEAPRPAPSQHKHAG